MLGSIETRALFPCRGENMQASKIHAVETLARIMGAWCAITSECQSINQWIEL